MKRLAYVNIYKRIKIYKQLLKCYQTYNNVSYCKLYGLRMISIMYLCY